MENKIELSEIKKGLSWHEAMALRNELGDGWELPEFCYLKLLYRAKLLGHPDFQDMSSWFWSSSIDYPDHAKSMDFYNGFVSSDHKTHKNNARCVRASKEAWAYLTAWIEKYEGAKNGK